MWRSSHKISSYRFCLIIAYTNTRAITQVSRGRYWANLTHIESLWYFSFVPRMNQIWPIGTEIWTDGRTDVRTEWTDRRTDDAKTISLLLRRGKIDSISRLYWIKGSLSLWLLGNFSCFFDVCRFFSKSIFLKKTFCEILIPRTFSEQVLISTRTLSVLVLR